MGVTDDYKTANFTASDGKTYNLRMSPKKHLYSYQEEGDDIWIRLPSVTTVGKAASGFDAQVALRWQRREIGDAFYRCLNQTLNPELVATCLNAAESSREGSADRGTLVHEWMEAMFSRDEPLAPFTLFEHSISTELKALHTWANAWNVRPILIEQMVAHIPEGYAGTLDLLAYYTDPDSGHEGIGLFDLKTGKGVYPQNFNQLSAYWHALEWMDLGDLPEARYILHLPEGATEVNVVTPLQDHKVDLTAFRAAQYLYDYNRKARRS